MQIKTRAEPEDNVGPARKSAEMFRVDRPKVRIHPFEISRRIRLMKAVMQRNARQKLEGANPGEPQVEVIIVGAPNLAVKTANQLKSRTPNERLSRRDDPVAMQETGEHVSRRGIRMQQGPGRLT